MVKPTILPDANCNQVTQLAKLPLYFLSTQGVLLLFPHMWSSDLPWGEDCDLNSSRRILFFVMIAIAVTARNSHGSRFLPLL